MSGASHTPGPWRVFPVHGPTPVLFSDTSDDIAELRWLCRADFHEANARLIAAAPELLEALSYAANTIEAMRPSFSQVKDEGHAYHDLVLTTARAAIAKATGAA